MKAKKEKIEVVQNPADPVPVNVMATAIRDIAKAMQSVNVAGLNRRALLLLLAGATQLPMKEIDYVLNALSGLEDLYCIKNQKRQGSRT